MVFWSEVSQPIQHPHSDPIVLTLKVGIISVRRILVDTGSTANLITMDCLKQLKYDPQHLGKLERPLVGIGGGWFYPSETIVLPLQFWEKGNDSTMFA